MKLQEIRPRFVEFVPKQLEEGVLYISERFKTASHLCACGCGTKVVTPLSPAEWQLRKEGDQVSLYPSIGNWNDPCQSHYFIRRNRVLWAERMNVNQVASVQARDRADKRRHVDSVNRAKALGKTRQNALPVEGVLARLASAWKTAKDWWTRQ